MYAILVNKSSTKNKKTYAIWLSNGETGKSTEVEMLGCQSADEFKAKAKSTNPKAMFVNGLMLENVGGLKAELVDLIIDYHQKWENGFDERAQYAALIMSYVRKGENILALDSLNLRNVDEPLCPPQIAVVKSIDEANKLTDDFVFNNDLMNRDFNGGNIFKDGRCYAQLTTNGKCRLTTGRGNYDGDFISNLL